MRLSSVFWPGVDILYIIHIWIEHEKRDRKARNRTGGDGDEAK